MEGLLLDESYVLPPNGCLVVGDSLIEAKFSENPILGVASLRVLELPL